MAGYVTYRFLIDTGADFSLAPRRLAQRIGLDWDRLPEGHVSGIERGGLPAHLGLLPVRLGGRGFTIRCLFTDLPSAPFILSRADFLDRFMLTIDQREQRIILTEAL